MKIITFKVGKSNWKKEWGEIPYWVLSVIWTRKDSEYMVGISTSRLNYDDRLYILPTISYRNAIPGGDIRKAYKHWTIALTFLKWSITLCDFQKSQITETSESETD